MTFPASSTISRQPAAIPALCGVGLLLFCLPWVEIRCRSNDVMALAGALPSNTPSAASSPLTGDFAISRSGLQMALGQATVTQNGRPFEESGMKQESQGIGIDLFLAIAYALALVSAAVLAVWRPHLGGRATLIAGSVALAMLLALEGFSFRSLAPETGAQAPQAAAAFANMAVSVERKIPYLLSYAVVGALVAIGVQLVRFPVGVTGADKKAANDADLA